jgi:hypothetical protein
MTITALAQRVAKLEARIPKPRLKVSHLSSQDLRKLKDHFAAMVIEDRAAGRLRNLASWEHQLLDEYEAPPQRLSARQLVRILGSKSYEAMGFGRAPRIRVHSKLKANSASRVRLCRRRKSIGGGKPIRREKSCDARIRQQAVRSSIEATTGDFGRDGRVPAKPGQWRH